MKEKLPSIHQKREKNKCHHGNPQLSFSVVRQIIEHGACNLGIPQPRVTVNSQQQDTLQIINHANRQSGAGNSNKLVSDYRAEDRLDDTSAGRFRDVHACRGHHLSSWEKETQCNIFSDQACAITKLVCLRDVHACRGHHLSSSEKETQCNIFFISSLCYK